MLTWGALLAETSPSYPSVTPSSPQDTSTLRWAVRTDNNFRGFLFVNNYQRLLHLPAKSDVRFHLVAPPGSDVADMSVPSAQSAPVTVPADSWFTWPIRIPLLPESLDSVSVALSHCPCFYLYYSGSHYPLTLLAFIYALTTHLLGLNDSLNTHSLPSAYAAHSPCFHPHSLYLLSPVCYRVGGASCGLQHNWPLR